jgi:hypothetical protein
MLKCKENILFIYMKKSIKRRISKRTRRRMLSRKKGGAFFSNMFGNSPKPENLPPRDDITALRKEVNSLKSMITNTNDLKLVLDRTDNLKTLLNKIESVNTSLNRVKSTICD